MQVQIVALPSNNFCLVDLTNEWKEGLAVDLRKQEIIYYNGDYGQLRPKEIRKLVVDPIELGWVSTQDKAGNITTMPLMKAHMFVLETIIKHNGMCTFDHKKIQGKYIVTLPI